MKRKIKRGSSLYAYLDKLGVLETGSPAAIEDAKNRYWKDYRTQFKKRKRQEKRSFEVFFTISEGNGIAKQAKRYNTSPTNYIKQTVLSNKCSIIDPICIGRIRELAILHYTTLLSLKDDNKIKDPIAKQLLSQASELEERLKDFFHKLKSGV